MLKLGMEKWGQLWGEIDSRIDVNNFYSLPSLAQYYFKINDCFDGCFQLCGSLGAFFQNFVSGGRVMTRNNVKQYVWKLICLEFRTIEAAELVARTPEKRWTSAAYGLKCVLLPGERAADGSCVSSSCETFDAWSDGAAQWAGAGQRRVITKTKLSPPLYFRMCISSSAVWARPKMRGHLY